LPEVFLPGIGEVKKHLDRKVREEKSAKHAKRLEDVQIKRITLYFSAYFSDLLFLSSYLLTI